ncbi:transport permease protein [Tistrella bauzanensis]|uniref:Transport permease protein n=1 Tax=Tistrella bauzanensis TaxID=657419 RepID=A0ABQ1IF24_9PROT|nr:ABC transporter permease [Tistrella bauzanensis]GGB38111.1 transport permease protein [Tistrella bauzanensis]
MGEPRHMGAVNWRGFATLYLREVRRFGKVAGQTLTAPVVTGLLFLAIFSLALGRSVEVIGGVPYLEFLAPGLVMMQVVQNAFSNSSSSLMISKVQGNIVDVLMAPLSATELTLGYALGAVTRGVLVGVVLIAAMSPFVHFEFAKPGFVLFHLLAASLMMALIGILAGVWADKFDQMAAITNFVITPLSFLSGTFYSVDRLPDGWSFAAHINPFFYMIDGIRYGMTGHADGSVLAGVLVLGGVDLVLGIACWMVLNRGWKLKA